MTIVFALLAAVGARSRRLTSGTAQSPERRCAVAVCTGLAYEFGKGVSVIPCRPCSVPEGRGPGVPRRTVQSRRRVRERHRDREGPGTGGAVVSERRPTTAMPRLSTTLTDVLPCRGAPAGFHGSVQVDDHRHRACDGGRQDDRVSGARPRRGAIATGADRGGASARARNG